MDEIYCANLALQTAVSAALEFYGLDASPTAANSRSAPAVTFAEQLRRIDLGSKVLALVRRSVPVGEDDRRLILRLVDSGCRRLEDADRPAAPSRPPTRDSVAIAYAAAGGGAYGTFEDFRRTFTSIDELLGTAVDRQDVKPPPSKTNPSRRPNPPGSGSTAPAKTNPTMTIRSSRWTAGRKAVRS